MKQPPVTKLSTKLVMKRLQAVFLFFIRLRSVALGDYNLNFVPKWCTEIFPLQAFAKTCLIFTVIIDKFDINSYFSLLPFQTIPVPFPLVDVLISAL